jgi:phosphopantothenoylcysteine synthetase/decarboxylase
MKILITSGGTDVPIDDVRKITNMSSGKYGAEIATVLHDKFFNEHDIWYLGKKGGVFPNPEIDMHFQGRKTIGNYTFSNFDEYMKYSLAITENNQSDIIVLAAAVSDYILDKTEGKISSDNDELVIRLKKAPKVLPLLREAAPNALLVGFKLLVSPSVKDALNAIQKVFKSGADLVVYNDLTEIRKGNAERLVFTPDMKFKVADDASALVDIILDHKK